MQGAVLNARGDFCLALEYYKKAVSIGYAVSGSTYDYCKDLWRIAGSAMRCGEQLEAVHALSKTRSTLYFSGLGSEADEAFQDLTLGDALPWGVDKYDPRFELCMRNLIDSAIFKSIRLSYAKAER